MLFDLIVSFIGLVVLGASIYSLAKKVKNNDPELDNYFDEG